MIWPWYVFIVLSLLATTSLVGLLASSYQDKFPWVIALVVTGLAWLVFLILCLTISIGRHYNRLECQNFAAKTNRTTKFVIYTTFSWDCLTPDRTGRWIPTKNLRVFSDD